MTNPLLPVDAGMPPPRDDPCGTERPSRVRCRGRRNMRRRILPCTLSRDHACHLSPEVNGLQLSPTIAVRVVGVNIRAIPTSQKLRRTAITPYLWQAVTGMVLVLGTACRIRLPSFAFPPVPMCSPPWIIARQDLDMARNGDPPLVSGLCSASGDVIPCNPTPVVTGSVIGRRMTIGTATV